MNLQLHEECRRKATITVRKIVREWYVPGNVFLYLGDSTKSKMSTVLSTANCLLSTSQAFTSKSY